MWTPCIFWYTLYNEVSLLSRWNNISYPLFANADGGIYQHSASQYHVRLKAKHGIAMLSVDQFQYLQEQTRGNEFIPCSKDFYYYQKYQKSFLLGLNHCVNTVLLGHIAADRKDDDGRDHHWDIINNALFSYNVTLMTSNMRYVYILHGC